MFRQFKELQKSDAREGMVTTGFWKSILEFYREQDPQAEIAELQNKAEVSLDRLRCFEYASCWSMSDGENALMWRAYAPQGIAIRSTVRKFIDARQESVQPQRICPQRIEYADHWRDLQRRGYRHNGTPLNRLFLHTKRKAFASEREVRFRIAPVPEFPLGPDGQPTSADPNRAPPWFPVQFENLNWIEEVVAESSIPQWCVGPIHQLADQHNLTFRASEI